MFWENSIFGLFYSIYLGPEIKSVGVKARKLSDHTVSIGGQSLAVFFKRPYFKLFQEKLFSNY